MQGDSSERVAPSLPENAVDPVKTAQKDGRISGQQYDVDRRYRERAEGSPRLSEFDPGLVEHFR